MDVVRFMGGLGNQMFQYAFLRSLENQGREVVASLGFYKKHPELMQFELNEVFYLPKLKYEIDEQFMKSYNKRKIKNNDYNSSSYDISKRFFWKENLDEYGLFQKDVYNTQNCTFAGYWQSYLYFDSIKELIKDEFEFRYVENKLQLLMEYLFNMPNSISLHVRRGDYLKASDTYGGICTYDYYKRAVEYVQQIVSNPFFVVVSDDIKWVKENYKLDNSIYISSSMFDNYKNWYDMAIMSACSNNIIANSSFSWWGAWLNRNENKIVIAPKRWVNNADFENICPSQWVRM